ncbi:hypothetical protein Srufu_054750 [Streptomyces libani subsp. rufus]|nr:hypothetical protein Srufu_054750 [Streptomyces libani subsp. rufus]
MAGSWARIVEASVIVDLVLSGHCGAGARSGGGPVGRGPGRGAQGGAEGVRVGQRKARKRRAASREAMLRAPAAMM